MTRKLTAGLALLLAALVPAASAEDELTSLSYISYLERYATVRPASQDESIEAVINLPLVAGDRVDTAREARVEVVLADGSWLWLDEYTSVSLDAVAFSRDTASDRTVLFLAEGSIVVEVPALADSQRPTRVDGSAETVYLSQPGLYRIMTTPVSGLRVEVTRGLAEVATAAGGMLVRTDYAADLEDQTVRALERFAPGDDDFARWVEQRRQAPSGNSLQYVDPGYERQAGQLDNYGTWVYLEDANSWAWQPRVTSDWRPYTAGRWYWTSAGWNWVSYEPWGWLPYHYGSWYMHAGYGWVWGWGSYWSPAWVHWYYSPGYVGWCPMGYYSGWWGGYYGWDDDHHHHGGHGGHGGHGQPGRDDTVPRAAATRLAEPREGGPSTASTRGLDLSGRVRADALDGGAWSVVAADDFASPHLTRLVKPADVAFRDRAASSEGVVRSGALVTASPAHGRPAREIEQAFTRTPVADAPDLSRVVARDSRVPAAEAVGLARPTTQADLSRAAVTAPTASDAPAASRPVLSTSPTSRGLSPVAGEPSQRRATTPNLYRPVNDGAVSNPASRQVTPRPAAVELRVQRLPAISDAPSSPAPSSSGTPAWRSPTASSGGRSATRGSATAPSSRSVAPSSPRPAPSSTRPVIVPRSSGATSPSASGKAPSASSSRSSSPSVRPSGGASSGSSGSSTRSSSASSGSSGSSSGSSSRSSTSSSSASGRGKGK